MPAGEIHYKFFKIGYLIEIPEVVYLTFLNPIIAVFHLAGYSFHRWVDPDTDLMGSSAAEGRMVNELKFFGYVLYGLSSIYGAVFRKKHRSFWTHFPIVSTIIRLFFFFFWIPILYYFKIIIYQTWHLQAILAFVAGDSQADMIHYLCDMFWSEDSKRWVEQDKEKKWRNGYHRHIHSREKVTHKFNGQGQIDEQIN